jgi:hypothetical protein
MSSLRASDDVAWRVDVALKAETVRYLADLVAPSTSRPPPYLPELIHQALTHAFSEEGLVLRNSEGDELEELQNEDDDGDGVDEDSDPERNGLEELENEDDDGDAVDELLNSEGDKFHHTPIGLEAFGLAIFSLPKRIGRLTIQHQHSDRYSNSARQ